MAHPASMTRSARKRPVRTGTRDRMPRVLLIDSSRETERVLRRMLEGEGYEVELAQDAKAGMESVHAAVPHVVLIDLSLSPVPAWKVIREIKAAPTLRTVPVLAIATATQGAERQRALAAGC